MLGMYRGDFVRMIQDAAKPHSVIKFYTTRHGNQDTLSIVDFYLPKREGLESPGKTEHDWFIESFVCNVGMLGYSWIPRDNRDDDTGLWRGIVGAVKMLRSHDCIEMTDEINYQLRRVV